MTHTSVPAAHVAEGDFRVGSVISRSASLLSRYFLTFFIVAVIAYLPTVPLAGTEDAEPADPTQVWLAWALSFVSVFVLHPLAEAIIVHAAFQDMRSRPVRPTESLNVVLRRFLTIVGLAFVVNFLMVLGVILLIIPGLMLYTMWFVALPACVVERLGPWTSLRRSRELTKRPYRQVFGLALLLTITSFGGLLVEFGLAAVAGPIVGRIGNLIGNGLWLAFAAVVGTVIYHDLRVIKEGIDLEQIADVFD
jgi:hypothetical protein